MFIISGIISGICGETKEERSLNRRFTSCALALLGGIYGGNKFCSSMVEFRSLCGGDSGSSSIGISSVTFRLFFEGFSTLLGGVEVRGMSLSEMKGAGPITGAVLGGF